MSKNVSSISALQIGYEWEQAKADILHLVQQVLALGAYFIPFLLYNEKNE